jgi:hypothetical protein
LGEAEEAGAIVLAGADVKGLEEDAKEGGYGLWREVGM